MTTKKRLRAGDRSRIGDTDFEVGTGNVFADLGLENPDERRAKAALAGAINAIIEQKGWTQAEAAKQLRTHQPVISALRHGRLRSLSYDRLVNWLVLLGRSIEIHVKPARNAHVAVAIAAG
ncbi:MAG TPA: helix-turn-helix transcriptional regulator [Gemmatimonadaceae bacterium]|jgi:predicted XRE-type DNA-binding protein|nr:helix-turn-helix transcriptional regulator [Gemmatimonadaceae bacterium]